MRIGGSPERAIDSRMTDLGTIRDRAANGLGAGLLGRERELTSLEELAAADGPSIAYLNGPYGIGKTALISAFETSLTERGISVAKLSGNFIEPRSDAFIAALGAALGTECRTPDEVHRTLASRYAPFVLILDDVDGLRLIATWLRRDFTPSLPANVRLLIAGRSPPPAAWVTEFGGLYRAINLGPLARQTVVAKVLTDGLDPELADRLWAITAGHPLMLRLAMQVALNGSMDKVGAAGEIVSAILADADEPCLTALAEAAAIIRRATPPLMAAMAGPDAARSLEAFLALPFVQSDREGHYLAEPVRKSLAERLVSIDPDRYAAMRAAAATWISGRLKEAGPGERWRYMADLLHLVEHAQIRDAFFPPNAVAPPVEPAERGDFATILRIVKDAAGEQERSALEAWIRFLPHRFSVARGPAGEVLAFYVYARADDRLDEIATTDPLLLFWQNHHRSDGNGGEAIFLRQLIAANANDDAPERAACLLDLKRAYFERWDLSRVYTAASAETIESPVYRRIGFRPLTEPHDGLPGSMVLELPSTGLIAWVSALVGVDAAPAVAPDFDFARDRREVVVDGKLARLTRLEAEVLEMLIAHSPAVVGREEMIAAIWRRAYVGSNVVDTVIRSLRKKLGSEGQRIGTVPKSGYRLIAARS